MSWSVAKLALPITRFSIMRPATVTVSCSGSSASLGFASCAACRSAASASRRKSLGNALPFARSAASLARRSATIWFSSCGAGAGAAALFWSDIVRLPV